MTPSNQRRLKGFGVALSLLGSVGCATAHHPPPVQETNSSPEAGDAKPSPPPLYPSAEIPAAGDEALAAPGPAAPAGGYVPPAIERVPSFGAGAELKVEKPPVQQETPEDPSLPTAEGERAPSFGEGAELLESQSETRRRRQLLERDRRGTGEKAEQNPDGSPSDKAGAHPDGSAGAASGMYGGNSAGLPPGGSTRENPAYPSGPLPPAGYGPTPRLIPIVPPTPPTLRPERDNQLEQTVYWMQTEVYGIQITLIGRPLLPRIGQRLDQLEGYAQQVALLSQAQEDTRALALEISREASHVRQLTGDGQRRELEAGLVHLQQLLQQLRVILATQP